MANITPRKDKDGNIISYQIRVFRGRDASGRRLKDYMMTWRPAPGMTKRQIEKALNDQAVIFEKDCKNGIISLEKPTFAKYAEYVVALKARTGKKVKTIARYRDMLPRINEEIGHLKLQDIRADHLNQFYEKMAQPGQRRDGARVRPITDVGTWMKSNKMSQERLAKAAGVGTATIRTIREGNTVSEATAQKVSTAMGLPFKRCFETITGTATLSDKTILEHHRLIRNILAVAVKEGLLPYNTADRATPPTAEQQEVESLEIEEVQAIMEALNSEPLKWQVCIHLLIATGARRGEIMGLRWESVNWKQNSIYICENRVYTPQTGAVSTTTKNKENRTVTVSVSVMELLKKWRTEQAGTFMKLGITPSGYVMTSPDGSPMHPDSPTDWLYKFTKRHGLPKIHPHLFRHTQASLLIAEGVDILTVSKRLGHAKVSTTTDIYAHALAKSDAHAADALDDILYKKKAL